MAKKLPDSDDWPNPRVSHSEPTSLRSSTDDLRLQQDKSPNTAPDYESWYAERIRYVFSSITSDLLEGLFGPLMSGPVCFRATTDFSLEQRVTHFAGEWQRNRYQRFLPEQSDARATDLISKACKENTAIAILLHYRPRRSRTVTGFAGRLDSAKSRVLEFEKERERRFSALDRAEKPSRWLLNRRVFELEGLPPSAGNLAQVYVCAPKDIISRLRIEAENRSALPGTSARFSWPDWSTNTSIIGDAFDRLGGDLLIGFALHPETCQARWVTPKPVEHPQEPARLEREALPNRDPEATVDALASRWKPPSATDLELAELHEAIRQSRLVPADRRDDFCTNVNRILETIGYSIVVHYGEQRERALRLDTVNGSVAILTVDGPGRSPTKQPFELVQGR